MDPGGTLRKARRNWPTDAGGLRDLLPTHGEPVGDLVPRASVPVSLHQEQSGRSLGNQVGWMAVPLPVGEPCHARRLALIALAELAAGFGIGTTTARRYVSASPSAH